MKREFPLTFRTSEMRCLIRDLSPTIRAANTFLYYINFIRQHGFGGGFCGRRDKNSTKIEDCN